MSWCGPRVVHHPPGKYLLVGSGFSTRKIADTQADAGGLATRKEQDIRRSGMREVKPPLCRDAGTSKASHAAASAAVRYGRGRTEAGRLVPTSTMGPWN